MAFKKLLADLVEALDTVTREFKRAGEIVVQLVDHDKYSPAYIRQACPALSKTKIDLLLRIGRGELLPPLLLPANDGERMLAEMPIAEQRRFMETSEDYPVEALDGGKWHTVLINPLNFTKDQVNQCSRMVNGVRHWVLPEDQRAWLVDHRTNLATRAKRDRPKWVVRDGCVVVTKNTILTREELSAALNDVMNPPPAIDVDPA